jgi:transcription-repair coupling factor (superfamily II helicase)
VVDVFPSYADHAFRIHFFGDEIEEIEAFDPYKNTKLEDYKDFLNAVKFSKIEKIADLSTSVFDRKPTRPLWILYK